MTLVTLKKICPFLNIFANILTNGHSIIKKTQIPKPKPLIFELACKTLGEEPDAVLHVGDHPMDDVLGALDAGFQAVWINRRAETWTEERKPHAEVQNLIELADLLDLPAEQKTLSD